MYPCFDEGVVELLYQKYIEVLLYCTVHFFCTVDMLITCVYVTWFV